MKSDARSRNDDRAVSFQRARSYAHRNCADSTAVVFLSIRTALIFLARLACINALSCFLDERLST